MKTMLLILTATLLQATALASAAPESLNWPLKKVFIPIGFDNNNNVQVVVEGVFPNTCYQVGPTSVKTPQETGRNELQIQQTAYKTTGMCLEVQNPFYKVIDVGMVSVGAFAVRDLTSDTVLGNLPVEQGVAATGDDFPYAPVRDATVGKNKDGSKTLMIIGYFTDKCMKLRGTPQIHYQRDVVVVQPIIEMDRSGGQCGPAKVIFQEFYNLRSDTPDNFLLHVRSMDGQAINKIIGLD